MEPVLGGVDVGEGFSEGSVPGSWLDDETRELAEAYVSAAVLSSSMLADAQHIALATVARVDAIASWNFRHIVNLRRIHGFNSVNLRRGYPMIEIRSPRELLDE